MLEYGQPMHAFDYRYVKGGKIVVRRAQDGEELTTLDGNVRRMVYITFSDTSVPSRALILWGSTFRRVGWGT